MLAIPIFAGPDSVFNKNILSFFMQMVVVLYSGVDQPKVRMLIVLHVA